MNENTHKNNYLWAVLYVTYLGFMVLGGGNSLPTQTILSVQTVASSIILIIALLRLAQHGFPSKLSKLSAFLAAAALGLILIQLIPLPQGLWQLLPDREMIFRNFVLLGETPGKMPFSLTPEYTGWAALSVLPFMAGFLGALTISPRHFIICGLVIMACTAVGVVLSLLQIEQGGSSPFYLYESEATIGVGTYNNRNFFAAQLYTSIVIAGMVLGQLRQSHRGRLIMETVFTIAYVGIVLAGLALSGSRSGILLGMLAIPVALFVTQKYGAENFTLRNSSAIIVLTLMGLFIVGQSSMLGLLRLANNDIVDKSRLMIFERSVNVLSHTFPAGGGFGSFVPLYQQYETPRMIDPGIINHAHNDWLEIAIEGGLAGMILEAFFIIIVMRVLLKNWWPNGVGQHMPFQRGAIMAVLLLCVHSVVDFPLRTPAMMTLFAFCCGAAMVPTLLSKHTSSQLKPPNRSSQRQAFKSTVSAFKSNIH